MPTHIQNSQFASADFRDRVKPETLAQLQDKFREGDPVVQVVGKDPMKIRELQFWLKGQYEDAEKLASDGKVRTAIIIRADQGASYGDIFELMHLCRAAGYQKVQLRAYIRTKG